MVHLKKRNGHLIRTGAPGSGHLSRSCLPPGLPCSYCGSNGPRVGGVIQFSGIPTSFSSSYFDGSSTHNFTISCDLNHSRVIDLIQIGTKCCWYAPVASVATCDFTYVRTGPSPVNCNRTSDVRTCVFSSYGAQSCQDCTDEFSVGTNQYYSLLLGGTVTVITPPGSCVDAGGGQRFDWGSSCGSEPALDFMSTVPFPNRIYRQVLSWGISSPGTGVHALTACGWSTTLNCGLGTVTWTPF